jgi:hypothetical protein
MRRTRAPRAVFEDSEAVGLFDPRSLDLVVRSNDMDKLAMQAQAALGHSQPLLRLGGIAVSAPEFAQAGFGQVEIVAIRLRRSTPASRPALAHTPGPRPESVVRKPPGGDKAVGES